MILRLMFQIFLIKSQIIIQFEREWVSYPLTKENLFQNLYRNQLVIKLKIGSEKQEIPLNIRFREYESFIFGLEVNQTNLTKFNNEKSSSFHYITKTPIKYSFLPFEYAYTFSDTFYFNQSIFENFPFILVSKLSKFYSSNYNIFGGGIFGLKRRIYLSQGLEDFNIIKSLKKKNYIKSYAFTFKFNEENNGKLIIGGYPHQYDKNYKEKNFVKTKAQILSDDLTWAFIFDVTYSGNEIIEENCQGDLIIEYGFIVGNKKYYNYILDLFFNEKIKEGKCYKELNKIDQREYYFYSCDNNVNVSIIPELKFSLKEIEMNFTFNENDLWYNFEGRKYFLVLFQNYGEIWYLGKPFFKKYQIVFDQDSSVFGFYNENIIKPSYYNYNWIIIIFLIIIILGLIGYIFNYFLKTPRRKRVNELLEEIDYISS